MFELATNKKEPRRAVITVLVLIAVVLIVTPIPVGLKKAKRAGAEPFPCQHCSCGCESAEQCWSNCCCFTPDQRLAWAKENNVVPPTYAVVEAPHTSAPTEGSSCGCGAKPEPAGLGADDSLDRSQVEYVLVLSIEARKCRGGSSDFLTLPWTIIEQLEPELFFADPPAMPYVVDDEQVSSVDCLPDKPPPQSANARV